MLVMNLQRFVRHKPDLAKLIRSSSTVLVPIVVDFRNIRTIGALIVEN